MDGKGPKPRDDSRALSQAQNGAKFHVSLRRSQKRCIMIKQTRKGRGENMMQKSKHCGCAFIRKANHGESRQNAFNHHMEP